MIIGLTGGIGSGKTTVAKIFSILGVPVFYSDDVAKSIVNTDTHLKNQIIELLGEESYLDEIYNRKKVADIVFTNTELLHKLNQIIHPAVAQNFKEFLTDNKSDLVLKESALLFETGIYKNCDVNILVTAPLEMRIKRVMQRDAVTEDEVLKRISNQWNDEKKLELANYEIKNDGTEFLIVQVESVLDKIKLK